MPPLTGTPAAAGSVTAAGAPTLLSELVLRPMTSDDIPSVVAFEQLACAHPLHAWTLDNYRSSLASGYWTRVACRADGRVVGVCVVMFGVDELHLLNIAVADAARGQGVASLLLDLLVALARTHRQEAIWLEVRPSNERARALYARHHYLEVGRRKNYYPAVGGREDAVVMKREVALDAALD